MRDVFRDGIRAAEAETERWMRRRAAEVRLVRQLADAGRRRWEAGIRTGAQIAARTPEEIRLLGEQATGRRRAPAPRSRTREEAPTAKGAPSIARRPSRADKLAMDVLRGVQEVRAHGRAAMSGAADELTFGLADRVSATAQALVEPGGIGDLRRRIDANLAEERARDLYDQEHYGAARMSGQVGGTVLSIALPGGAYVRGGRLLHGAAKLTRRELAALVAGGAAGGAGTQIAMDAGSGRVSSPGDVVAAGAGGAAGVLSHPLVRGNPTRAAAVDGFVTSVVQDLTAGRRPSLEDATQAAMAARLLGAAGAEIGRVASDTAKPMHKYAYGEALGRLRSRVNGYQLDPGTPKNDPLSHGYWRPDARSGDVRFEYKGGYGSKLSTRQRQASSELGDRFVYYHTTPDDIAHLTGVPMGWFGHAPEYFFRPEDDYEPGPFHLLQRDY